MTTIPARRAFLICLNRQIADQIADDLEWAKGAYGVYRSHLGEHVHFINSQDGLFGGGDARIYIGYGWYQNQCGSLLLGRAIVPRNATFVVVRKYDITLEGNDE